MKASFLFSWILRGRGGGGEPDPSSSLSTPGEEKGGRIHRSEGRKEKEEDEEDELGVTKELLEFLKGFTVEVFKQFPISDRQDDGGDGKKSSNPNVRKDLSKWQERHATFILTTVKEIARLRYEIRAIQKEKLRKMELEHEKSGGSVGFEVEMTDAKQMTCNSHYNLEDNNS